MNKELGDILHNIWLFSTGLNKTLFQWNKSPTGLTVLAGTDTTGIVKWKGRKYYVSHEWQTNSIIVENY
jgi:hypothetical protein